MEMKETEIAMGDCIKNDLERVGEEWKNDKRNWILLTVNVVRKSERKKKDIGKGIHVVIFYNMDGSHIQENNNNKLQFEPSLGQLLF